MLACHRPDRTSPIPRGIGTAAVDMIRPMHSATASAFNHGDPKSSLVLRLTSLEHLDESVHRAHLGEFRMSELAL